MATTYAMCLGVEKSFLLITTYAWAPLCILLYCVSYCFLYIIVWAADCLVQSHLHRSSGRSAVPYCHDSVWISHSLHLHSFLPQSTRHPSRLPIGCQTWPAFVVTQAARNDSRRSIRVFHVTCAAQQSRTRRNKKSIFPAKSEIDSWIFRSKKKTKDPISSYEPPPYNPALSVQDFHTCCLHCALKIAISYLHFNSSVVDDVVRYRQLSIKYRSETSIEDFAVTVVMTICSSYMYWILYSAHVVPILARSSELDWHHCKIVSTMANVNFW